MKKLFLLLVATVLMLSCATSYHGYHGYVTGVVEDVVSRKDFYKVEVWCEKHHRYYNLKVRDSFPQIGEVIEFRP